MKQMIAVLWGGFIFAVLLPVWVRAVCYTRAMHKRQFLMSLIGILIAVLFVGEVYVYVFGV